MDHGYGLAATAAFPCSKIRQLGRGDNIPYSSYFDNALKDKSSSAAAGVVPKMNPSDPEENKEAFIMYGGGGLILETSLLDFSLAAQNQNPVRPSSATTLRAAYDISTTATTSFAADHDSKHHKELGERYRAHRRIPSHDRLDQHHLLKTSSARAGGRKTTITTSSSSESSSNTDKSNNSDYSLLQSAAAPASTNRREKPERSKEFPAAADERSDGFSPASAAALSSRQSRQRSASRTSIDSQHHRAASVPKFGAWDETDPTSGDEFTVIFSRVKEEKQIASTTLLPAPAAASPSKIYVNDTQRYRSSEATPNSSAGSSKFCCCLFLRGSERERRRL